MVSPNGIPYYLIHHDLVMTLKSAMLVMHLEFEGKRYGTVEAKFLHD